MFRFTPWPLLVIIAVLAGVEALHSLLFMFRSTELPAGLEGEFWLIRFVATHAWTGLLAILAGLYFGLFREAGWLRAPADWQPTWPLGFFIAFTLFAQADNDMFLPLQQLSQPLSLLSYIGDFAIGFSEEALLRAFALLLLLKAWTVQGNAFTRPRWAVQRNAVLASSVIFGLWHLLNLSYGGLPNDVYPQVIYTFNLGIVFGSMMLLMRSVWPAIIAHGFFDFGATGSILQNFLLSLELAEYPEFAEAADGVSPAAAFEPALALQAYLPFILLSGALAIFYLRKLRNQAPV